MSLSRVQHPPPEREAAPTFYDAWVGRLLGDYASGNRRAEAAISLAVAWLPAGEIDVLDIGCGIGWSTFELARHDPAATLVGIDLSSRLIRAAGALFGAAPRRSFETCDFAAGHLPAGRFDAIVLLDVYEHFPIETRAEVHARLQALLKPDARLVLSTPTVEYQQFLRAHDPAQLQPIDEDVSVEDMGALAADVGGHIVSQAAVSIWRPRDYLHTVIERGAPRSRDAPVRLEERAERAQRIHRAFGLRWTRAAGLVAARGPTRICVAQSRRIQETFIRPHIEDLPADVRVLGAEGYRSDDGRSLLPEVVALPLRLLARMIGRSPAGAEYVLCTHLPAPVRTLLYRRYLRRERIEAVLAEFGPTAAELLAACRSAQVPLVTHFHGFDAFRADALDSYGEAYRAIFRERWPVIAVSASMKRQLVALGATPGQVHIVPYGINLDQFRPGEQTPGLVVMVGRLVAKKGPKLALEAFARAAEQVADARLVIIGDGPLRPDIERRVRELGLHDRVRLDGERDHAWVAETIRRASVFVQHSLIAPDGDREGAPVAIAEAGAAGVPVVATRHEGIAEIVVDGETGLLVEEGDVAAMAHALTELLGDRTRARRMGLAASGRIATTRSRAAAAAALWNVLEIALRLPSDSEGQSFLRPAVRSHERR